MTDTDTVERVAKAVFSASTFFGKWEDQPQSNREVCVDMARAAIAALTPIPETNSERRSESL